MAQIIGNLFDNTSKISSNLQEAEIQVTGVLSESDIQIEGTLSESNIQVNGTLSSLGLRGFSAYDIAVKNGFVGTEAEWLDSLKARIETKTENGIIYYKFKSEDVWLELIDMQYLIEDINSLNDKVKNKVDAKDGYSLVLDSEIERLATLKNYDDTEIVNALSDILNKIAAINQSLEDYATKEYVDTNGGKIDKISVNGVEQEIKDKTVDILIPTNNNQLINGAGYITITDVAEAIANASHLKREIVNGDILPNIYDANSNTIYMLQTSSATGDNKFTEWMVINGVWEKIGSSDVNLDGYVKTDDLSDVAYSGDYNDLKNKIVVDDELSLSSTNTVQNKVIKEALDCKSSIEIVRW